MECDMNNLTPSQNIKSDSTHAGIHHYFRIIRRPQTPINSTTLFYWLPLVMVRSVCGPIAHTVDVICPKHEKSIILMAQI
eukprot:scaffold4730_cov107-Skeletonema_marinoi.AAC.4